MGKSVLRLPQGSSQTREPQGMAAGLPSFLALLTQRKLRWVLPSEAAGKRSRGSAQPLAAGELSLLQGCWHGLHSAL